MAFATWNPADKDPVIVLSNGNLTATLDANSADNQAVRGTQFKSTGKWYCEFTVNTAGGVAASLPRLGLVGGSGVYNVSADALGDGANFGWSYDKNGNKRFNSSATAYGAAWTTGDVISMLYDADADTLTFWKNGVDQGQAFASVSGSNAPVFFSVGDSSVVTANFGVTAFAHTPPVGYAGWSEETVDLAATIPAPVLVMGGAAALAITIPVPVLAMGGAASLEITTPRPALAMATEGLGITMPMPIMVMETPNELILGITAPVPVLSMGSPGGLGITIPIPVLGMTGDSQFNQLTITTPVVSLQAAGQSGTTFNLNLTVPAPILALGTPPALSITVPAITASLSGINGGVGAFKATVPFPQLAATGKQETLGVMNLRVSMQFSATALSENIGEFRGIQVRPRLVATALSGANATMDATIPILMSLSGYPPYVGSMAITHPFPVVEISASAEIAAAMRTWVLNLRRKALTEYDNFNFNSYVHLYGAVLSAGDGGLFLHAGQGTDAGTFIDSHVRTGKESFGTSYNKRVPRLYVNYKTDGAMTFSTITSQGGTRVYSLPYNGLNAVQERRVPVGRGPKSPYWQFEMMNVNGSDFLIEKLQPYPEKTLRRVV